MDIFTPHIALPFRFIKHGGLKTVAVTEQDSEEEIKHCIEAVVRYRQGQRIEKPEFGISEHVFTSPQIATEDFVAAISRWEPRAAAVLDGKIDTFIELAHNVTVGVSAGLAPGEET